MSLWTNVGFAFTALKQVTISYINSFKSFNLIKCDIYPAIIPLKKVDGENKLNEFQEYYKVNGLTSLINTVYKQMGHSPFYLNQLISELFDLDHFEVTIIMTYSVKNETFCVPYTFTNKDEPLLIYPPIKSDNDNDDDQETGNDNNDKDLPILPDIYSATLYLDGGQRGFIDVTDKLSLFLGPNYDFHKSVFKMTDGISLETLLTHWGIIITNNTNNDNMIKLIVEFDDGETKEYIVGQNQFINNFY